MKSCFASLLLIAAAIFPAAAQHDKQACGVPKIGGVSLGMTEARLAQAFKARRSSDIGSVTTAGAERSFFITTVLAARDRRKYTLPPDLASTSSAEFQTVDGLVTAIELYFDRDKLKADSPAEFTAWLSKLYGLPPEWQSFESISVVECSGFEAEVHFPTRLLTLRVRR